MSATDREARPARKTNSHRSVSITPARRLMLRGGTIWCMFYEGAWTLGHISLRQDLTMLGTFGDDFEAAARRGKLVARTLNADLEIIPEDRT